ncbi:MAG: hypothetical protein KZQ59_10555 [Candidatus Thiodiazotropha sp. (ex Lucinoma aequizonata)]|nr:hypothetical protein [Candidatus Thiodiazotropha sp. (ex Lucinoma aequizonata)]MCU7893974.1 hypothetical protein [Candidatus Thiodiazotropha sp. (ex Lucinoma aequizonata)]MCU7898851.1 hypothetical protein [Candidatus Thiodiazotropha sp. (ex Lucinoma aequizonata)]MCU7910309.1 hypothetical protein [Candidatus Thiodiazotropha sp. (ex Lucinoma aequizonata)]MCU7913256.1 hypothetical protein [Candidatus Thiodiazotropha sp. (ex Lucinoma aequizonata)]
MRSLYALHLSLSVAIPAIQPRLRLSGTNRLRSAFHGDQRWLLVNKQQFSGKQPATKPSLHCFCWMIREW